MVVGGDGDGDGGGHSIETAFSLSVFLFFFLPQMLKNFSNAGTTTVGERNKGTTTHFGKRFCMMFA